MVHGKSSNIEIDNENILFNNLENEISVGRYHSLSVNKENIPEDISIIAKSKDDNEIMQYAIENILFMVYSFTQNQY